MEGRNSISSLGLCFVHRLICMLLNVLHGLIFDELLGMVVEYLKSEERLMHWLPNELAEAHKQEHAELSGRLAELVLQPNIGPVLMKPSALYEVVHQWPVEHITDWDMPLAKAKD